MQQFIANTLQLKDKNIYFNGETVEKKMYKGRRSLFYHAQLSYIPERCPECGTKNEHYSIVKNGTRTSRLTLIHVSGLPAYLMLKKQRFFCKKCLSAFTAQTAIVDQDCFVSTRVKQHIADQATKIKSVKMIAEKLKIRPVSSLPDHLSFDEFKSVNSVKFSMSFIYCDALTHRVVVL